MRVRSRRVALLEQRVADLEARLEERLQADARVAELADVVAELLVPLHLRDERRVDEVLARYRAGR